MENVVCGEVLCVHCKVNYLQCLDIVSLFRGTAKTSDRLTHVHACTQCEKKIRALILSKSGNDPLAYRCNHKKYKDWKTCRTCTNEIRKELRRRKKSKTTLVPFLSPQHLLDLTQKEEDCDWEELLRSVPKRMTPDWEKQLIEESKGREMMFQCLGKMFSRFYKTSHSFTSVFKKPNSK